MNEEQRLMEQVRFGIEVESFLAGPVGSYLVEKARAEEKEALEQLAEIDPTKTDDIRALQNRVHRAKSIEHWLAVAVQEGYHAEHQLRAAEGD